MYGVGQEWRCGRLPLFPYGWSAIITPGRENTAGDVEFSALSSCFSSIPSPSRFTCNPTGYWFSFKSVAVSKCELRCKVYFFVHIQHRVVNLDQVVHKIPRLKNIITIPIIHDKCIGGWGTSSLRSVLTILFTSNPRVRLLEVARSRISSRRSRCVGWTMFGCNIFSSETWNIFSTLGNTMCALELLLSFPMSVVTV